MECCTLQSADSVIHFSACQCITNHIQSIWNKVPIETFVRLVNDKICAVSGVNVSFSHSVFCFSDRYRHHFTPNTSTYWNTGMEFCKINNKAAPGTFISVLGQWDDIVIDFYPHFLKLLITFSSGYEKDVLIVGSWKHPLAAAIGDVWVGNPLKKPTPLLDIPIILTIQDKLTYQNLYGIYKWFSLFRSHPRPIFGFSSWESKPLFPPFSDKTVTWVPPYASGYTLIAYILIKKGLTINIINAIVSQLSFCTECGSFDCPDKIFPLPAYVILFMKYGRITYLEGNKVSFFQCSNGLCTAKERKNFRSHWPKFYAPMHLDCARKLYARLKTYTSPVPTNITTFWCAINREGLVLACNYNNYWTNNLDMKHSQELYLKNRIAATMFSMDIRKF